MSTGGRAHIRLRIQNWAAAYDGSQTESSIAATGFGQAALTIADSRGYFIPYRSVWLPVGT